MCWLLRAGLAVVAIAMAAGEGRAQEACDTRSEFKGETDPAVLGFLADLKGTVAMRGNSVCSGALVTFKGRNSSARALVLSAGHCADRGSVQIPLREKSMAVLDDGEVLYGAAYQRSLTLDTGKSEEPRTCIEADQVLYATLTAVDVLLLRLTETYSEIEQRTGVVPFVISRDSSFSPGLAVRMPSSLWQNDRKCRIEATVRKVKEFRWQWGPVMRLRLDPDTCLGPHGASGAPLIRNDTGEVVGVFGTSGDTTAGPCEINNPCEVKEDGGVVAGVKDQNYVHFVHQFYACLDASGELDLAQPGCRLPKPQQREKRKPIGARARP